MNWEEIAKSLLNEAYRRLAWARDETLKELIMEMLSYPGVPARWREPELEAPKNQVPVISSLKGELGSDAPMLMTRCRSPDTSSSTTHSKSSSASGGPNATALAIRLSMNPVSVVVSMRRPFFLPSTSTMPR